MAVLTEKQREVKDLMDSHPDLSVPEIAERLGISKPTAYQHVRNIGGRAKAKRRAQRERPAPQHIVPPPDESPAPQAAQNGGSTLSLEDHIKMERDSLATAVEDERTKAEQLARGVEEKEERLRRIDRMQEALHAGGSSSQHMAEHSVA